MKVLIKNKPTRDITDYINRDISVIPHQKLTFIILK